MNRVRICYKGDSDASTTFDIADARHMVEIGMGRLNPSETRLRLNCTKEDSLRYMKLMDGRPDRFASPHVAESLRMGAHTMNKAAVEDSGYHQMLADSYRCSPDKTQVTRR